MKTFKEYLAESKKAYSFKVKVAGELPENFQEDLKARLDRCGVVKFDKINSTPIQAVPMDFPTKKNMEIHVFEVICEYPITAPEIALDVKEIGIDEDCFRVRGSSEPSEVEQVLATQEPSGKALLDDAQYKESGKVDHTDYFGDEFNKSFLKDLSKTAKARKKEGNQVEYKISKNKQDKEGAKSAIGS